MNDNVLYGWIRGDEIRGGGLVSLLYGSSRVTLHQKSGVGGRVCGNHREDTSRARRVTRRSPRSRPGSDEERDHTD